VNVRVVWVNEARKLAGIQLLDLTEHDRQLIRKWGAQKSAQSLQPEPHLPLVVARPSSAPSESPHPAPALTQEWPFASKRYDAPPAPYLPVRARLASAAARVATSFALLATVGVAAAFILRNGAQAHYFARSLGSVYKSSVSGPPAQEIPASLPNSDTLKPGADSPPASPPPRAVAEQSTSVPSAAPALQPSAQTGEDIKINDNQGGSASGTSQNQRHASRKGSTALSKPISQANPTPDTPRLIAENPTGAPNDQSELAANPPATDLAPMSSTTTNSLAASDAAPEAPPVSPGTPAANEPTRNPALAKDVATAIPTPIPSSPIIAPTHTAPSPRSEAPVIQMDAPARQVLEIHLPSGYYAPFFNLPGERVLESPSATVHIQRSVRLPSTHVRWSFNPNKKVVIGGLVSRVDPEAALVELIPGDSVRVRATVAKNGSVESVTPLYGPTHLVRAVVQAVHQWHYQPTLLDGKPAETQCYVVVQFHAPATRTARK